ncbi:MULTISPECIES: phosphotransferase [unclassified Nocardia]|uniref:phosphotransferase n=1 Tax=unclassified Nocardia TaxID=2637762 RepID=UPI001CE43450|nr:MULTISPECIES: phosphotransferase [unclassified Nocardia]
MTAYDRGIVVAGDRVFRPPPPRAAFVHELLEYFAEAEWLHAPRYLGSDSQGREILSHIPGFAGSELTEEVRSTAALAAVARLVREFHDLTAGHPLAGSGEVVCHNDLSPKNTIYRLAVPVALIDWDLAAPGRRIHDVAHLCWQYGDPGPGAEVPVVAQRMRVIRDAYGRAELIDPPELIHTVLWWQDRCRRGIEHDPALAHLRAAGVPERIRAAHRWVSDNRGPLTRELAHDNR